MIFWKKNTKIEEVAEPLARIKRKFLFLSLVVIFCVSVPMFVFYAAGYRYVFLDDSRTIISTGGLYVFSSDPTAQIYVDEAEVRDARVFRRALYIQNLTPGMHRVHVTAPNLHTWVKVLPVYPHIVTEAEAFMLPVVPQMRVITKYLDTTSNIPLVDLKQFYFLKEHASTTLVQVFATSTATTTVRQVPKLNSEYELMADLFTAQRVISESLVNRVINNAVESFQFQTSPTRTQTGTPNTTGELATSTKTRGSLSLFQNGEDIFVRYEGDQSGIPYYFCVPQATIASTTEVYGAHVMRGIQTVLATTATEPVTETGNQNRVCREEIMIDRQGAHVLDFDFINIGVETVIMHREDGVFVTEIDDRSWQNTQRIYGPTAEMLLIDSNRVYIKDTGGFYVELFLTLLESQN